MKSLIIEHVFDVDLNAVRGDQVGAMLTLSADPIGSQLSPPSVGDTVFVRDEESNLYLAQVNVIDGLWLGVTIDWSSRKPDPRFKPFGHAGYEMFRADQTVTLPNVVAIQEVA